MTQELITLITKHIQQKKYPGANLALFRQQRWQEYSFGTRDGQEPLDKDALYDLASVSKVLGVGTLCIQLYAAGRLELDVPLTAYYPAFHDSSVTIRQLLTHTSGLDPFILHRDTLSAKELRAAMNQLRVTGDHSFHYTDVNFVLLGFMLEYLFEQDLAQLFAQNIFTPFGMTQTSFGPRFAAVPTVQGISDGYVHDPKAKVLGVDTGSAGLFSTLLDLEKFVAAYQASTFWDQLFQDYNSQGDRPRSLAWRLSGQWLDHTGYTGPFIMLNQTGQAAIFLTNRTYYGDDRRQWAKDRDLLMAAITKALL
ncbi:MAG: serine hydrolase [Streptococcus pyogenes]|nr:MAG: serine hydrolase [Streptococcus pyogenes]